MTQANIVHLRDVQPDDLPIFFEYQCDPVAIHMSAFTPEDPTNKDAFDARWTRILGDDIYIVKDDQSTAPIPVGLNLGIGSDGPGKAGSDKGREGYLGIVSSR